MYKALQSLTPQEVEPFQNKKVLLFEKKRHGLAHRPIFGYKILKFMTFPSHLGFPQYG